jgi:hypothetical protein
MGDRFAADRPAMVEDVPAACRASSNKARFLRVNVDIWQALLCRVCGVTGAPLFPVRLLTQARRFRFLIFLEPGRDHPRSGSSYRAFYRIILPTTTIFLLQ